MQLPHDAQLDDSGNAWECDAGFDARHGSCLMQSYAWVGQ